MHVVQLLVTSLNGDKILLSLGIEIVKRVKVSELDINANIYQHTSQPQCSHLTNCTRMSRHVDAS